MNGAQDMGGVHGFGPIQREADEPVFHAEWERRAFAVTLAMGAHGKWNIDATRFARENTPPGDYLARNYYEMWLYGLEKLLVEKGFCTEAEIEAALAGEHAARVGEPPLRADDVAPAMAKGSTARVEADVAAKFRAGDRVRARNLNPTGHTRAPRYVRGRQGTIDRDHGVFVFPDTHAMTGDKKPQHVYAVRFEAAELWGPEGVGGAAVYVDLWDDHLEPA
ncbi:MAG: nitrile hydratase subunit beta [Alphaproteobacteria bacterium]|nr:nitrile hydratase subunit beta [Alphaproteobacteria bacterium]